jgi:tetratricopeptide (TPR) repeat protein
MVGVLRQYVEEKLRENQDEHEKTRRLFNEYYAGFLNEKKTAIQDMSLREIAAQVSSELDNIRIAWIGMIESNDRHLIETAFLGAYVIYDMYGWLREGVESFEKAVEGLKKSFAAEEKTAADDVLLGKLKARMAMFLYQLGHYEKARNLLKECLSIARKYKDDELLSVSVNTSGNISFMLSDFIAARKSYEAWMAHARKAGNKRNITGGLNNLGVIAYTLHEYDKALKLYEESRKISEEIGFNRGALFARTNIALVLNETGKHHEAKAILKDALVFDRELNDQMSIANTLNNLGLAQKALGELDDASRSFEESLKIRREIGDRMGATTALTNMSDVARRRGDFDRALELQEECLKINRELKDVHGETMSHFRFGKMYYEKKELPTAKKFFLTAYSMARKSSLADLYNLILLDLACIFADEGDRELSSELASYVHENEKNDGSVKEEAEELLRAAGRKIPARKDGKGRASLKSLAYIDKKLGLKAEKRAEKKTRKKSR